MHLVENHWTRMLKNKAMEKKIIKLCIMKDPDVDEIGSINQWGKWLIDDIKKTGSYRVK